jgi:hypothetical protein
MSRMVFTSFMPSLGPPSAAPARRLDRTSA